MLGSGNYSSQVTCFTADWFVSHQKRIWIWSYSFMHKGLVINKGLGKSFLSEFYFLLRDTDEDKWMTVSGLHQRIPLPICRWQQHKA